MLKIKGKTEAEDIFLTDNMGRKPECIYEEYNPRTKNIQRCGKPAAYVLYNPMKVKQGCVSTLKLQHYLTHSEYKCVCENHLLALEHVARHHMKIEKVTNVSPVSKWNCR